MGHQTVKGSGFVLQGSQETSRGGWNLLEVCMSQLGGLGWGQGWWCGQQGQMEQGERQGEAKLLLG